jgi:LPXTG-motif cell wall-anchored protein
VLEADHVDSTTLGFALIAVAAAAGLSWVFVRRRESFRFVAVLTIAGMLLGIVLVLAIPLVGQSAD